MCKDPPDRTAEGIGNMHIIYENKFLRVEALKPQPAPAGSRVLLSFPGIGQKMDLIDVQTPEFAGIGREFGNTVFCYDKTRSWGNRLDWDVLTAAVRQAAEGSTLYSIGNSMGGYLAIVAGAYLPITRSVSFVPQLTVDPEAEPHDTRWRMYSNSIKSFPMKPASHYFAPETEYFIFSAGKGVDGKHAQLFPKASNIHHWVFPDAGHRLAANLKEQGELHRCIQSCFEGETEAVFSQETQRLSPAADAGLEPPAAACLAATGPLNSAAPA
ncbi:hypothetical protein [Leisingera sp. ANG-M6]|uniref:hypothetical protein n=1 Tax=Leisingera sp. ANG-M6 TaxID=1577900 RepID=UPI00057FA5EF|nr:hypothetical protein [Leisingera sp. ANG-M6]KIC28266.1 hypothetical protein RA24_10000 [Leisingera sp. ANG-M6]